MGLWIAELIHTNLIDDPQRSYETRVGRVNQFVAAIAPILAFVGAILAAIIGGK
jgi:hypothetical protein